MPWRIISGLTFAIPLGPGPGGMLGNAPLHIGADARIEGTIRM